MALISPDSLESATSSLLLVRAEIWHYALQKVSPYSEHVIWHYALQKVSPYSEHVCVVFNKDSIHVPISQGY